MASLAPPISIHFTRKQLAWLDSRRRLGALTRSAAMRQAIDALIQQEEGSLCPSDPARPAATAPRQLELSASSTPAGEA